MSREKFVLVSLQEEKAKKLAQVISNESCRKILDFLAEKDATETELSKKLELPISTVHYNLKLLVDGGLVRADEYHYSQKGKEVNHYKLANKYIIIAPKSIWGIKEKLKGILPAALILAAGAGVIQLVTHFASRTGTFASDIAEKAAAPAAASQAAPAAAPQAAPILAGGAPASQAAAVGPNIALWFLFGAMAALLIYLAADYIRSRRQN